MTSYEREKLERKLHRMEISTTGMEIKGSYILARHYHLGITFQYNYGNIFNITEYKSFEKAKEHFDLIPCPPKK
jgi:hypothetical protein